MKQRQIIPESIIESVLETTRVDDFGVEWITLVLDVKGSDTQISIEMSGEALEYTLSEIYIND